jgi:hypothetical protein
MSKELEVNWKTKHKKFGEIHIKSINLDNNYMWTDNEECSCIGADSTFAKELYPTIPMLMNKELKQSLDELEELKSKIRCLAGNHILSKIEEVFGKNNSLVNKIEELQKLVGAKDE